MRHLVFLLTAACVTGSPEPTPAPAPGADAVHASTTADAAAPAGKAATETGMPDMDLVRLDGAPLDKAVLDGKVVLFVNVASKCGFTPQYEGLQALHDTYAARGFTVVGVPCNQFGGQEPGSAQEIASFCQENYGVRFPMLEKQKVNGKERSPLYDWLVDSPAGEGKKIGWNFEKFLVGRDGTVLARWPSRVAPQDAAITGAIEKAL
jgi:glutathione peroxidase